MKLSIIVPTYKREVILCQTIDSIILGIRNSQLKKNDYELIIVDQTKKHTREVEERLQVFSQMKFVKYIYTPIANLPNARNIGILHALGDIVLFLDDDVVLHKNFFDYLITDYQKYPEICSVVGLPIVKNDSGTNILLKADSFWKRTAKKILIFLICRNKSSVITSFGFLVSNRMNAKSGYADSGRGCVMSFKKEVFKEVGRFDDNYQGNALREETDMFIRIKKNKGLVFFDSKIIVDHIMANNGGCRAEKNETYWQTYFDNQFYFFYKNFNFSKLYIKCLLAMDIRYAKSLKVDINKIIDSSYNRCKSICKNAIQKNSTKCKIV